MTTRIDHATKCQPRFAAFVAIGAAVLALLIHLDPIAALSCAQWQAENHAF